MSFNQKLKSFDVINAEKEGTTQINLPELLGFYMTEKHMDDITLARKCNISPMNIVNIKNGSHTYSQQLVENLGSGLELNTDEMRGFMGAAGF